VRRRRPECTPLPLIPHSDGDGSRLQARAVISRLSLTLEEASCAEDAWVYCITRTIRSRRRTGTELYEDVVGPFRHQRSRCRCHTAVCSPRLTHRRAVASPHPYRQRRGRCCLTAEAGSIRARVAVPCAAVITNSTIFGAHIRVALLESTSGHCTIDLRCTDVPAERPDGPLEDQTGQHKLPPWTIVRNNTSKDIRFTLLSNAEKH